MKKWVTCILAFYILFNTVVPCSIFDKCEEEQHAEQSSNKDQKKDCNGCSPFSVCSSAHGFTLNTISTSIEPIKFNDPPVYSDYYISSTSEYYSKLFQPPRVN